MTLCYQTKLGSAHPHTVKPIYWHWVMLNESKVFIVRWHIRSPGQLVFKKAWTPQWFQESIFKVGEGEASQGMWWALAQFWLVDDEVTGWCHQAQVCLTMCSLSSNNYCLPFGGSFSLWWLTAGDTGETDWITGSGRSPGGEKWLPTPIFLSEKSHGLRSLVGYSPNTKSWTWLSD